MKTDNVKILAIVGMSGSGKTVAVDFLTSRGTPKIYFGGIVLSEMERRGLEITPENEQIFRKGIRATEGEDWVVRQAISEIKDLIKAGQKRIVLDGVYTWAEYKLLKSEFPGALTVIAVIAPRKTRYARLAKRPVRPLDAKSARERDYHEIEQLAKGGPIAIADYYVINNSTKSALTAQLKDLLYEIKF